MRENVGGRGGSDDNLDDEETMAGRLEVFVLDKNGDKRCSKRP